MFKKTRASSVYPTDKARKRAAKLGDRDIEIMMNTLVSSALPESYGLWTKGLVTSEEVRSAFQATIAVWEEIENRYHQDQIRQN